MINLNFINFTNHPSVHWNAAQRQEALKYGTDIVDVAFPNVDPYANCEAIIRIAADCVEQILQLQPAAVLCQGEFSLTYAVANALLQRRVVVLAACSERVVSEVHLPDGKTEKKVTFNFVRFREYGSSVEIAD